MATSTRKQEVEGMIAIEQVKAVRSLMVKMVAASEGTMVVGIAVKTSDAIDQVLNEVELHVRRGLEG